MNVDKVLERDQKLSELDNRADALQAGASQFETSAAKLKRKYWWKNCKMMIILGVVCAVILIIIIRDLGRQDGADSTIWGILAHDLGLLAAAAVVKNFSHITISEHLGQKRSSLNIHSVLEQSGLGHRELGELNAMKY
ncbi:hypothetical protein TURU_084565 [Turdus rufiventris]|nr:hypothetical protein TURU_084565 [Turdus rufiventris]